MRSVRTLLVLVVTTSTAAAEVPEAAVYSWVQGGNIDPYALPYESPTMFRTLAEASLDIQQRFADNADAICRTGGDSGYELVSFQFEDLYNPGYGNHGTLSYSCTKRRVSDGSVFETPSIGFNFLSHCRPGASRADATVRGHKICFYRETKELQTQDICPVVTGLDIANSGVRHELQLPGPIGLLTYTSQSSANTGLGAGWNNVWTARLNAEPPTVSPYVFAYRPNGQAVAFTYETGAYTPDPRTGAVLETRSDTEGTVIGWLLSLPDGTSETYDRDGNLSVLSYPGGNEFTVTRDMENRIAEISDTSDQKLTFAYEGRRVASITDAAARTVQLHYSEDDDLVTLTAPDNTQRHLHYNEQAHTSNTDLPHALTGVTDERGVRVATYEYYPDGRVKRSSRASGASSRTINYDDSQGTRTVTTGGGTTTYHTTVQNGERVLTQVQGPCCSP